MYPYIRSGLAVLRGRRKPKLPSLVSTLTTHHRAWPWDTDMYNELNHGRILTLFEVNRWELAARMGLITYLWRNKLGFTVAGVSVRYRRRVPLFARYRIETRPLGWDEKFIYIEQQMWIGDMACNQLLLRTAFLGRDGVVPPGDAAQAMGHAPASPPLPDWVQNWIDAETTRPWPPEPI